MLPPLKFFYISIKRIVAEKLKNSQCFIMGYASIWLIKILTPSFPLSNTVNYVARVLICLRGGVIEERG
jgi:hypothetical protein